MAKQKQTVKLKEPVRIRFKQLSNGNQSIYLEHYTGDVIRKENYVGGKRTNAGGQGEERSDARPCQSDSEQTDRRGAKRCARIPEHEQVPSEPARLSGKYREAVR